MKEIILGIIGGMVIFCFLMAAIGNYMEKINISAWFAAGCIIILIFLITIGILNYMIIPIKLFD